MLDLRKSSINRALRKVFISLSPRSDADSGASTAAIKSVKADACVDIVMRQNKCLNNIARQDHCAIKRITRPMPGFKSFWSARIIIARTDIMHMIRKEQMDCPAGPPMSAAQHLYSLDV